MFTIIHSSNAEMHEVKAIFPLPCLFSLMASLTDMVNIPVNIFTFLWQCSCGVDSWKWNS